MTVSRPSHAGVASCGHPEPDGLRDAGIQDFKESSMEVFPSIDGLSLTVEDGFVMLRQTREFLQQEMVVAIPICFAELAVAAIRLAVSEANKGG